MGAARLLLARGCRVDLLDLALPREGREALAHLQRGGARLRVGPHDPDWASDYDFVVKSPGVPRGIEFLRAAERSGVAVIGECELAFLASTGPVLAITGTNGKSTTTAWAGDMLRRAGAPALVVGNIGRAFSEGVLEDPAACFVCEISSFQLEDIRRFRPRAAVILNFTPDHLDRHGSLEEYREAKLRIFARQGPEDLACVGPDPDLAAAARPRAPGRWARFGREDHGEEGGFLRDGSLWLRRGGREACLAEASRLSLPGPHNVENALAAAVLAAECPWELIPGASPPERQERLRQGIVESLTSFGGLPHRLQPAGVVRGVRFVNDSKATNTDSLAVALRAFAQPVVLIAGGRDKGQDFRPLRDLVRTHVHHLVLIGEAAETLERSWPGVAGERASSLEEAVEAAWKAALPGRTVLLSPACASFDMFANYEDRGRRFCEAVARLATGAAEDGEAS